MSNQVQITFRGVPRSRELTTRIKRAASRFERICPALHGCRVVLERPHNHLQQGNQFQVRIAVKVPGGEIVVNRDHDENAYVALRDALKATERRIKEHAHHAHGGNA